MIMVHYGRAPSCNWDVLPNCTPQVPPPHVGGHPDCQDEIQSPQQEQYVVWKCGNLCIPPKWVFMYMENMRNLSFLVDI